MRQLISIFLILPLFSLSQDFGDYIKENAIEIKSNNNLSQEVYDSISKFELIMVGEMHGTQEPSLFVESLAKLIAKKEGMVSVGLEIPMNELSLFIENPTQENLLKTKFFSEESLYGRNSSACYNLISYCLSDTNINLFFFDNFRDYNGVNRDSIMYIGIKDQKIKFPNTKIITLSGNNHNSCVPINDWKTMGVYCLNDSINFSPNKICSIIHAYSEGTMLNNIGNGLELSTIPFEENLYSKSIDYENYLVFYELGKENRYNCLYYTKKVNHPKEIKK